MQLEFNREKYIQIVKRSGYPAALTQLHQDIEGWEQMTFEGQEGFKAEYMQDLNEIRAFSRSLWEMALRDPDRKDVH